MTDRIALRHVDQAERSRTNSSESTFSDAVLINMNGLSQNLAIINKNRVAKDTPEPIYVYHILVGL